ncbi:MAG TPA: hypothetical protein VJ208_03225 [Candidatus Nanoarchaeia archaeon]|nr:hypothetical protein [Candidatus Nanoarchaeia archaeon]
MPEKNLEDYSQEDKDERIIKLRQQVLYQELDRRKGRYLNRTKRPLDSY